MDIQTILDGAFTAVVLAGVGLVAGVFHRLDAGWKARNRDVL